MGSGCCLLFVMAELKEVTVELVTAAHGRGVPWVFLTFRAANHTQTREPCLFYITVF